MSGSQYLKPINRKNLFLSLVVLSLVVVLGCYCPKNAAIQPSSLLDTLPYYGFKHETQQQALELLLKKSQALGSEESLSRKFPTRKYPDEVLQDVLQFAAMTQAHLTIRSGQQERWQVKPAAWMKDNPAEIIQACQQLGLIDEIKPEMTNPDVLCILGSTFKNMQSRLDYAATLVNQRGLKAHYLILLTGQRPAALGIDGDQAELLAIAKNYHIAELADLMETHLMKQAYKNSALANKLPTEIIDTKAGTLSRPTTATTVIDLCQWLSRHLDVKKIIFVSEQPHIKYQEAVIYEVLKLQNVNIEFQVVGAKISDSTDVKSAVGALGSQIWAATPRVIRETRLMTRDPALIKEYQQLYDKQPFIYSNVHAESKRGESFK